MKFRKSFPTLALLGLTLVTSAAADCCGPPPAPQEQFQLGRGWSGSLIYERMEMNELRRGTERISVDQVLTERINAGAARYAVPSNMTMDRASVQLRYQFDDHHSLRVTVPWRVNQMDMRMASRAGAGGGGGHAHHRIALPQDETSPRSQTSYLGHEGHDHGGDMAGGHDMGGGHGMGGGHEMPGGHDMGGAAMGGAPSFMDMTMDQVDGLGDINLTYNYSFDLDGNPAWVGAGVALPTGRWDVRDSGGGLVHNMMQPGAGAVGLTAEAGADFAFGDSKFSIHPRAGVQWTATNPLGYQRGARFDYELGTRYQVHDKVGLNLDLVGFVQGQDNTNGALDPATGQVAFQRPETSLADDVANTGGHFLFLAPGIRVNPTESIFLGFQYRLPLYQNVRGTQLGIDRWYRVFLSAKF